MAKKPSKIPKKETLKPRKKGQKPIIFKKGGLHRSTHTPPGQKIPAAKIRAARAEQVWPQGNKAGPAPG